jgi:hypothetical protein
VRADKGEYRHLLNTPDEIGLAELAFRQHGAVSVAQLRALPLDASAVKRRVAAGELHRIHRGVYAVGHKRLGFHGRLWAAVLAAHAVVSHRSAAALYHLLPIPGGSPEVTTLGASHSTKRLNVHRSRTLDPRLHVIRLDGLPTTTPTRTIHDLAEVLTPHKLERVLDFFWPDHDLVVETDGAATHLTPTAFESDRRKDAELTKAGLRVVRFTYDQLDLEPDEVGATIAALLSLDSALPRWGSRAVKGDGL